MTPLAALLAQPFDAQGNRGKAGLLILGACASLGPVISLLIWVGGRRWELALPAAIGAALLILYWWFMSLSCIADACSPASLQTVPGLKRQATFTTSVLWFALSILVVTITADPALFALVCWSAMICLMSRSARLVKFALLLLSLWVLTSPFWGAAHRSTEYHIASADLISMQIKLLLSTSAAAAALLAFIGLLRIFPFLTGLIWVAWIAVVYFFENFSSAPYRRLIQSSLAATWHPGIFFGALAIIMMAILLNGLVGLSAERRYHRHRRRKLWLGAIGTLNTSEFTPNIGIRMPLSRDYAYWLDRILRRHATQDKLMAFCLGPALHWSTAIWCGVAFVAFGAIFGWNLSGSTDRNVRLLTLYAGPIMLMMVASSIVRAAYQTRREQALLSLAPGTVRLQALNLWFATTIARQLAATWLASIGVCALMTWLFDLDGQAAVRSVVVVTACVPWALAYVLRDFARAIAPRQIGILAVVFTLVNILLGIAVQEKWPIDWLAVPAFASGVILAIWRWQRMIAAPQAWPVGRLAED